MRSLAPALTSLLLMACAPLAAEQREYALRVRVDSDPGEGVPQVPLLYGQLNVGTTGADGTALVKIKGREGQRAPLSATCPDTHVAPAEPSVVVLRTYLQNHVPELLIRCPPRTRQLAVVVKAKHGEDLDLLHRGKKIGHTDGDGIAHLLLEGPPGDAFEVVLDTRERPHLKPESPGARFVIAANDEALLFDPELTVDRPDPPKRRRKREKGPDMPTRIR